MRHLKWRPHRFSNSVARLNVSPRISLILAMDTNGSIYWSMVQANTDADVMSVFMHHLVQMLKEKYPDYKERFIFQFDNASYHKTQSFFHTTNFHGL